MTFPELRQGWRFLFSPVHQSSSQEKRNNLHLQVDKCQLLNVYEKLLQQIQILSEIVLCVFS